MGTVKEQLLHLTHDNISNYDYFSRHGVNHSSLSMLKGKQKIKGNMKKFLICGKLHNVDEMNKQYTSRKRINICVTLVSESNVLLYYDHENSLYVIYQ